MPVYQKTVYNAASMPQIIIEPIAKDGVMRNIEVSTSIVCGSFSLLGLARLITIIITTMDTKVMLILSKKGKAGKLPLVKTGKNFSRVEIGMVNKAPAIAAAAGRAFPKNTQQKNSQYTR